MMEAYNKELLLNTLVAEKAEELYDGNFISIEQFQNINRTLPKLVGSRNNIIRIFFFFLGTFLYGSICGMISLIYLTTLDDSTIWNLAPFLFAAVGIASMELLITKNLKFYKNGIDDAFVLGIVLCIAVGLGLQSEFESWVISLSVFISAGLCYFRYINIPALLVSCTAFVATVTFVMIQYIMYGSAVLPILLAVVSAFVYQIISKNINHISKPLYFQGTTFTKYFAAIVFYLSLNYAVITELSVVLMPNLTPNTFSSLMSYLFIILTAVVPIAYIYKGIKEKDKPLFVIGLLAVAVSYATLRYYVQFMLVEVEMIFGGLLIFFASYLIMKKIKNNVQGVTFLPDRLATDNAAQLEILASVAQFRGNTTATESSPMEFGGGGFSGGGAGESF